MSHLDFLPGFSGFEHQRSLAVFIIGAGVGRAVFRTVVDVERAFAQTTPTHHADGDGAAVLHALTVSALEGNATARGQIVLLHGLVAARRRRAPRVIRRVFLQHVARADHHARGLDAVESSTLLLVEEGVVVGQLDQLIHFLIRILLLQILEDTDHLREKECDCVFI